MHSKLALGYSLLAFATLTLACDSADPSVDGEDADGTTGDVTGVESDAGGGRPDDGPEPEDDGGSGGTTTGGGGGDTEGGETTGGGATTGGETDGGEETTGGETDGGGETTGGETDGDSEPVPGSAILSAYYGLDGLPMQANVLCGLNVTGQDGLPVTFSEQLQGGTIDVSDFLVERSDGTFVEPSCATLSPALEGLELRTVLLTGEFGSGAEPPVSIEVVDSMLSFDGNEMMGAYTDSIVALEDGPSLVLAERYGPETVGLQGECPPETAQVVQMVWAGGVSGPQGAPLGEPQRLGVHVELVDGSVVTPIALADDDPDNFVHACVAESAAAVFVSIDPELFYDPGDDPNPATSVAVVDLLEPAR